MEIRVAEDIVPIAEFKARAKHWLKRVAASGQPVVITQNGRPAGVLLSPAGFDSLRERERFLESIAAGLADADAGQVMSTKELESRLAARRRSRTRRRRT